ncbi:MAG: Gfo/Idh/MocA family oxidoreductase [Kiritimatiellae bacterium]|nr:Gfo/Idh/MocA family oxidoreductase [Kiritimatiellia bacterium]
MNLNRRHFLLGSAAAAALAGCSTARTGVRPLKPGEKRNVALIGIGIQGRFLLGEFLKQKNVRVVAICDCDKTRREDGAARVDRHYKGGAKCRAVADFREVMDDPTIDAVCIATPDHWHAYISVEAMKHGKDVYCEKPMTFSIDEAKKVMAAQEKYGRVFQTGSMQRSWRVFRVAASLVRGGVIGDVRYVDANYGKGGEKLGGPSHPVRFFDVPENAAKESEGYEKLGEKGWDMWLGPARWRPYSNQLAPVGVNRFYPMFWRFDDDIGSGYNGDWGAHHLDIAQWGIDMDDSGPYRVVRSDEPYSTNLFHGGRRQFGMKMLFKSKKDGGDIELYHGPFGVWGTVFYGTNGIVAVNRGKIAVWTGFDATAAKPDEAVRKGLQDVSYMKDRIVAESVGKDYGTDAAVKKDNRLDAALDLLEKKYAAEIRKAGLYVSQNQIRNFCECIDSRRTTISPAAVGGRSCTLCLLCNISYVYDTGFDWDPAKMEFANGTGDAGWLRRAVCRNGWEVVV